MMLRTLALFLLATLAVALTADPVAASATQITAPAHAPLFADYWDGFVEHWSKAFKKQNGIIMTALLVGAVCLFIITRGKWRKN
jgi:spermidine/putrescine-binding protein